MSRRLCLHVGTECGALNKHYDSLWVTAYIYIYLAAGTWAWFVGKCGQGASGSAVQSCDSDLACCYCLQGWQTTGSIYWKTQVLLTQTSLIQENWQSFLNLQLGSQIKTLKLYKTMKPVLLSNLYWLNLFLGAVFLLSEQRCIMTVLTCFILTNTFSQNYSNLPYTEFILIELCSTIFFWVISTPLSSPFVTSGVYSLRTTGFKSLNLLIFDFFVGHLICIEVKISNACYNLMS